METVGAPRATSRLDLATKLGHSVPDGWMLVLYPDAGEASISYRASAERDPTRIKAPCQDGAERSVAEAVRRAKGQIRRYCSANYLDRFATLTYRGEGCHDPVLIRSDVGEFFKRLRRQLGGHPFPYIWAPEWHSTDHGLHAHFAVGQYIAKGLIEGNWRHGFVDIRRLEIEFGRASDRARSRISAAYLAKYVGKGFGRSEFKRHRYEVAEGFQPKVERYWCVTKDDGLEMCFLRMGSAPRTVSDSEEWEGWAGPPTVWMQWAD